MHVRDALAAELERRGAGRKGCAGDGHVRGAAAVLGCFDAERIVRRVDVDAGDSDVLRGVDVEAVVVGDAGVTPDGEVGEVDVGGVDDVQRPEDGVVDEQVAQVDVVRVADAEEAGPALRRPGAGRVLPVDDNLAVALQA